MPQQPDTRIPLSGIGGGTPAGSSLFGTLGQMMQIKEQQQANEARRRALEDDDLTESALKLYDRPDDAVQHLWKAGHAEPAYKLATQLANQRKAQSDETDAKIKSTSARLEQASQILQGVTDDASLALARPAVVSLVEPIYGQAVNDYIPTRYDKKHIDALVKAGTSRALQLQNDHNNIMEAQDAWFKGIQKDPTTGAWSPNGLEAQQKYHDLLTRNLSAATDQAQWNGYLDLAKQNGAPESVTKPWEGTFSPEKAKKAFRQGLTIPQEVTGYIGATNAETRADREERLGTAVPGGLNANQARLVEDRKDTENDKIEKWARDKFVIDNPKRNWPKGDDNKQIEPEFTLDKLSKEHQTEYVRQRLQTENNARKKYGRAPLLEAAKAAAASGRTDDYNNVRDVFNELTQGLVKLEDIVPPLPGSPAAAKAPAGAPQPGAPQPGAAGAPAQSRPIPSPFMGAQPPAAAGAPPLTTPAGRRAAADAIQAQLATERNPTKREALMRQYYAIVTNQPSQ